LFGEVGDSFALKTCGTHRSTHITPLLSPSFFVIFLLQIHLSPENYPFFSTGIFLLYYPLPASYEDG